MAKRHGGMAVTLLLTHLAAISGCVAKPPHNANWYYYWERDDVIAGLDRAGSPASRWDWDVAAKNAGVFGASHGPSSGYVLTDLCIERPVQVPIPVFHRHVPVLPPVLLGAATTFGIQQAAATMAHEKQHIENYRFRTADGQVDTDGDGLADSRENRAPEWFVIGDKDTYNLQERIDATYAGYGDNEFVARQAESGGVAAAKLGEDWSKGGAQWHHRTDQ